MERTDVLRAGDDRAGRAAALTPAEIRRRFAARAPGPDRGSVFGVTGQRGDHELNPGMFPMGELRAAAVLVPLVDREQGLSVLLTQRNENLSHHAGQIAFPGGRVEDVDPDAEAAALRETEEEIGLDRSHVEPIGRLDRYITRTGFTVTPVVGIVSPPFVLRLDPQEVADAFEVPLAFILDPANRQRHEAEYQGVMRYFYAFPYGDRYIWGATAGMLVNLAELLAG